MTAPPPKPQPDQAAPVRQDGAAPAKEDKPPSTPETAVAIRPVHKPPKPAPPPPPPPPKPVPAPAPRSHFSVRHGMILISFGVMVLIPVIVSAWYLWVRAVDQYASYVAFAVRTEEQSSSISSLLGPLQLGGASSAPDAEVLYQYVQSHAAVAAIDERLDLRMMWARADPRADPIFAYHPPGTIEDLLEHWDRMVTIIYDSTTGLIELRVLAFTAEDARAIADAIFAESTRMINDLSAIAREDTIRYSREELSKAVDRLKAAREALTRFRNETQIVDPSIDLQGQAGLLSILNQQLAEALIDLDLLGPTTRENDPRVSLAERKIQAIEERIAEERRKLGLGAGGGGSEAMAGLVGEFERLSVDREFAEQTYTAALGNFDIAQAEAQRQTRYLAAHIQPTLAEKSEYPKRWSMLSLIAIFAFLLWAITVLVAYSLRDRR